MKQTPVENIVGQIAVSDATICKYADTQIAILHLNVLKIYI